MASCSEASCSDGIGGPGVALFRTVFIRVPTQDSGLLGIFVSKSFSSLSQDCYD